MSQQQGFNDTINNVYSFPFTANSLLTFDLVHMQPNKQDMDRINTKPEHCAFVNFVPGEKTGGGRTYNFQNKITLKYSLLELEALHFVLRNHATTGGQAVTPYSKYAGGQSGGDNKKVGVWQASTVKKVAGQDMQVRTIFIQAVNGQKKVTINFTPDQAYAVSESLHQMYLKGTELEIDRMMTAPRPSNSYQQKPQQQMQQQQVERQPEPQQQAPQLNNSGIDDMAGQFGDMVTSNNPF
jgi:hypothetical protein